MRLCPRNMNLKFESTNDLEFMKFKYHRSYKMLNLKYHSIGTTYACALRKSYALVYPLIFHVYFQDRNNN